ncbi:MAG: hypothetical protein ACI3VZ_00150 [Faecousia sp.]
MKLLKKITSKLYLYLLWLVLSSMIWSWIFALIGDTSTYKKITIYVDSRICADLDLTLALEEDLPEGIRMIKVHPFSYVVFDEPAMLESDIYIIRESEIDNYLEALYPITEMSQWYAGKETCVRDGEVYGVRIYDAQTGEGSLQSFITYEDEDYYLVFVKESKHIGNQNGSRGDDLAFVIAERLLTMK